MPTRPVTVLLEPTGKKPCQGSRPSVDMNKLCGPRQVCPWASVSPSANQDPPQDGKDGQGPRVHPGGTANHRTMDPWQGWQRGSPGHYHSPGKAALASCTQLFPAPSLVPLALVPGGVGTLPRPLSP